MKNKWIHTEGSSTREELMELFQNEIPYVKVENFLNESECRLLVTLLRTMGFKQYDYTFDHGSAPPAANLFDSHYLYEDKTPEEYFPKARASNSQYEGLTQDAGFDPVQKVLTWLKAQLKLPVSIAKQEGQGEYTYVIARELNHSALLHADYAPFLSSPESWSISKILSEFAWNIYLTDPGEGGECVVYNRPWQGPVDDVHIIKDTYGYEHVVVTGCESVKIQPKPGMLLFFNSRNFHEVLKSQHSRLSLGGHIGLLPGDQSGCIAWV